MAAICRRAPLSARFALSREAWRAFSATGRTTFELRDNEGLPNVVTGKRLDAQESQEPQTWRLLKRAMDTKQEVYARVLQKTDRGYLLDILGRVAFLPMSLSGERVGPRGHGATSDKDE
jgi:hypothetical protein